MPNPTISSITLPSGSTYDIADQAARQAISAGITFVKSTDASDTPKGVTWQDNVGIITGTLEASSSTVGKFYLVPANIELGKDIYSEYVTIHSNEVYYWERIGTTDIDLSDLKALAYKDNASGTYTPEGSVSAPTVSVKTAGSTTSITPFGTQGTLPSLTTTVNNGTLTISFDQGTLPTAGTAVTVKTGDAEYESTAPTFSGTQATIIVS